MRGIKKNCALLLTLMAASPAFATIGFDVSGLAGSGVTGHVDFTYTSSSATTALLTITIENTTAVGGRISGFAFNVPTIGGATISTIGGLAAADLPAAIAPTPSSAIPENSATNEAGWYAKFEYEEIKTPNAAGDFDFGVMNANSKNSFITDGVGSGPRILNDDNSNDSTTFTFAISGTGLQSMSDADFEEAFMNELSSGTGGDYAFGVRYQGIPGNQSSDLATPGTPDVNPVPVPGAAVMGLFGLALAGGYRRFRK